MKASHTAWSAANAAVKDNRRCILLLGCYSNDMNEECHCIGASCGQVPRKNMFFGAGGGWRAISEFPASFSEIKESKSLKMAQRRC